MPQAKATLLIDDERVLVTRYDFAPGAETGHHVHGLPYVIVPLTDGQMHITSDDGQMTETSLQAGVPYSRPAGVSHNVINGGDRPLSFLEIEIKS